MESETLLRKPNDRFILYPGPNTDDLGFHHFDDSLMEIRANLEDLSECKISGLILYLTFSTPLVLEEKDADCSPRRMC